MLRAIDYEILRAVKASCLVKLPMARKPVRVATVMNEEAFKGSGNVLIHLNNVFLEDRVHDWDWHEGSFTYYSHVVAVDGVADVLVVYELEKS